MDLHQNARSCPASRVLLVERVTNCGWTVRDAAAAAGMSESRAYHWLRRFRQQGVDGLLDRSSRPLTSPHRTPQEAIDRILELRRQRLGMSEIASRSGVCVSTVARWLHRAGLNRLPLLAPPEPVRRYAKQYPGELLHLDIKKLGRIRGIGHRITGNRRDTSPGAGWEFVHVAIDDASRLSYVEVLPDEQATTAIGFLERSLAWYRKHGVQIQRLLTDNGSCYVSRAFAHSCQRHQLKHSRTRPYRPRTNGKAERFIQTLLREWAYAFPFTSSAKRTWLLSHYLHFYNHHREHTALGRRPPLSMINLNNVVRIHS